MHVDEVGLIDDVTVIGLGSQLDVVALGIGRDVPCENVVLDDDALRAVEQYHFVGLLVGEDVRRVRVGRALDRRQLRVADECEG